ncbi:hypothetical protein JMJ77_0007111 [Colletotrichum scovillei]|uniref:Uncharacterized protein n=1 Tax=Colletotrichum scovillei TaxID=1209932 RepID=A0A9P7RFF7_9PEZI|nr:hypothetical protein JMJ77_0007111 [Colletotrichum scovillei]KAG7074076.1 hypothetical protein JMJ76_0010564 [Colletotrichum scovillei]KAG7081165.1 hypothetical protein JMJ78_0003293 [Colletotrichum scovillei]
MAEGHLRNPVLIGCVVGRKYEVSYQLTHFGFIHYRGGSQRHIGVVALKRKTKTEQPPRSGQTEKPTTTEPKPGSSTSSIPTSTSSASAARDEST